jgi:hypothetical protein
MSVQQVGCDCRRCSRLPRPKVIGSQHEVAVVLHLDADEARAVAASFGPGDKGADEIFEAVTAWEAERDAGND